MTFRKGTYVADELANLHGLTVEVRFIPTDLETIEIFRNGRHICTAIDKAAMTADDREAFLKERTASRAAAHRIRRRASKARVARANDHTPTFDDSDIDSLAANGAEALAELLGGRSEPETEQMELL